MVTFFVTHQANKNHHFWRRNIEKEISCYLKNGEETILEVLCSLKKVLEWEFFCWKKWLPGS
jgi:hypothetical protein